MSQITPTPSRFRSASIKPKRNASNFSREAFTKTPVSKHKVKSNIKIEEKLLNNQIATKKRLEALKKTAEEDQIRELRSKPKISERSRVLAAKLERKMIEESIEAKEIPQKIAHEKSYTQVQPDLNLKNQISSKIDVESVPFSSNISKAVNKRTKSLLNLSVIQRSEAWEAEKNEKIGRNKKIKDDEILAECTFSPVTQFKSPHTRSLRENNISSNTSYISTPHSIDNFNESSTYKHKSPKQRALGYRQIAPFQINVAFKCGIDLQSFLKRAK
jgi:hypothetical protein